MLGIAHVSKCDVSCSHVISHSSENLYAHPCLPLESLEASCLLSGNISLGDEDLVDGLVCDNGMRVMCNSESPVDFKFWLLRMDACDSCIDVNSGALVLSCGCVESLWGTNNLYLSESTVLSGNVCLGVTDPRGDLEVGGV